MKKYSIGMVGLGEVAQLVHLPLLQRLSHLFHIYGIYDASHSVARAVAAKYGIAKVFHSAEELLAAPAVDVVFVLSPDQYHYTHAARALQQRKHIFIEKPICLSAHDVKKLCHLEKEAENLCLMVGYMRRFAEPFLLLKERIQKQNIEYVRIRDIICEGAFFIGQSNHIFHPVDIPQELRAEGAALLREQLDLMCQSGAPERRRAYQVLTGLCSHSLSAMRELLGPPRAVFHAAVYKGGEMLSVTFDYGNFCTIYECLIHNVAHFDASIEVLEDSTMYSMTYNTPYIRDLPMSLYVREANESKSKVTEFGPYYTDPFMAELNYFHHCLEHNKKPKTSVQDSLADFVLFEKILERL